MPGAGKTICAQYLARKGYLTLRFGAVVVEEIERRGWEVNPANERAVREELRAQYGMAAMATISLPKLRQTIEGNQNIVIDGLYSFSEYKLLTQQLGAPLILVAVVAARHLRYQRLAKRPIRPLTRIEAQERDIREIETLEKGGPIAMADFTLLNDQTPTDLLERLETLLATLKFTP